MYEMSNYFLMFSLTSDTWQLTPAADQTGKLFVGDAVLQVGTSVHDLFASRLIWVTAKSGDLLHLNLKPLLFWQSIISFRKEEENIFNCMILIKWACGCPFALFLKDNIVVKYILFIYKNTSLSDSVVDKSWGHQQVMFFFFIGIIIYTQKCLVMIFI